MSAIPGKRVAVDNAPQKAAKVCCFLSKAFKAAVVHNRNKPSV